MCIIIHSILGDADDNGVVDSRDATITLSCVKLDSTPVKTRFDGAALSNSNGWLYVAPNGKSININLNNADYNRDGFVTQEDGILILEAFLENDLN